jgi:hypothetical protein
MTLGLQHGRDGRVLSIELFERPALIVQKPNKTGSKYFPISLAHTQAVAYCRDMKTNKELVIEKYEALCNARLPGKGSAARQIVEKYWDAKSDQQVIYRLTIDLSINDNLVLQVLKDLAIRFPAMNEEIKSLKNN